MRITLDTIFVLHTMIIESSKFSEFIWFGLSFVF